MVAERFNETFTVAKDSRACWDVLTDVKRIAGWVPVISEVVERDHLASYSAVLEDRVGPFRMRADLDVTVTSLTEHESISIRADGEDRQIGSRITVDATMALEPSDDGCVVLIHGAYEVTGRAATMGASTIKQKANKMLDEFMSAARRNLS